MKELQDEFDNSELNHFTNFDYFQQLVANGRFSAMREFIKDLSVIALLRLFKLSASSTVVHILKDEIKSRTNGEVV